MIISQITVVLQATLCSLGCRVTVVQYSVESERPIVLITPTRIGNLLHIISFILLIDKT